MAWDWQPITGHNPATPSPGEKVTLFLHGDLSAMDFHLEYFDNGWKIIRKSEMGIFADAITITIPPTFNGDRMIVTIVIDPYSSNPTHSDDYIFNIAPKGKIQYNQNGTIRDMEAKYNHNGIIKDVECWYNHNGVLMKIQKEPDVYLARDSDFVNINGFWIYRGTELEVEIPTYINGQLVTSTQHMFSGAPDYQATPVTKVVLKHSNVTDMKYMFNWSTMTTLDLSSFDTSNVTEMDAMFHYCSARTLDLSSFNTSKVITMGLMLSGSSATVLDLSSFNTSNVTHMNNMFSYSSATILDLSSFDTSSATRTESMFQNAKATIGYARTQADANKLNAIPFSPTGLYFVVK